MELEERGAILSLLLSLSGGFGRGAKRNGKMMEAMEEHTLAARHMAATNQEKARRVAAALRIAERWEAVGAEVHAVGSLPMGLLVKHLDLDFHIYSDVVCPADGMAVMAQLAEDPAVERIAYGNLLRTEEACIEYHVWYRDAEGKLWQIDMIHIVRGSRYDGVFERMATRIAAALTDETRDAILRLKYSTPEEYPIAGVEYYRAVLEGGVRTFAELEAWRAQHPLTGITTWMP